MKIKSTHIFVFIADKVLCVLAEIICYPDKTSHSNRRLWEEILYHVFQVVILLSIGPFFVFLLVVVTITLIPLMYTDIVLDCALGLCAYTMRLTPCTEKIKRDTSSYLEHCKTLTSDWQSEHKHFIAFFVFVISLIPYLCMKLPFNFLTLCFEKIKRDAYTYRALYKHWGRHSKWKSSIGVLLFILSVIPFLCIKPILDVASQCYRDHVIPLVKNDLLYLFESMHKNKTRENLFEHAMEQKRNGGLMDYCYFISCFFLLSYQKVDYSLIMLNILIIDTDLLVSNIIYSVYYFWNLPLTVLHSSLYVLFIIALIFAYLQNFHKNFSAGMLSFMLASFFFPLYLLHKLLTAWETIRNLFAKDNIQLLRLKTKRSTAQDVIDATSDVYDVEEQLMKYFPQIREATELMQALNNLMQSRCDETRLTPAIVTIVGEFTIGIRVNFSHNDTKTTNDTVDTLNTCHIDEAIRHHYYKKIAPLFDSYGYQNILKFHAFVLIKRLRSCHDHYKKKALNKVLENVIECMDPNHSITICTKSILNDGGWILLRLHHFFFMNIKRGSFFVHNVLTDLSESNDELTFGINNIEKTNYYTIILSHLFLPKSDEVAIKKVYEKTEDSEEVAFMSFYNRIIKNRSDSLEEKLLKKLLKQEEDEKEWATLTETYTKEYNRLFPTSTHATLLYNMYFKASCPLRHLSFYKLSLKRCYPENKNDKKYRLYDSTSPWMLSDDESALTVDEWTILMDFYKEKTEQYDFDSLIENFNFSSNIYSVLKGSDIYRLLLIGRCVKEASLHLKDSYGNASFYCEMNSMNVNFIKEKQGSDSSHSSSAFSSHQWEQIIQFFNSKSTAYDFASLDHLFALLEGNPVPSDVRSTIFEGTCSDHHVTSSISTRAYFFNPIFPYLPSKEPVVREEKAKKKFKTNLFKSETTPANRMAGINLDTDPYRDSIFTN